MNMKLLTNKKFAILYRIIYSTLFTKMVAETNKP